MAPFAKWRKFMVGQGAERAGYVGLIAAVYTPVGNVGTGVDDLMTRTLKANVLYRNGQALKIKAWGTCAANGNNKEVKLLFGGTAIMTLTAAAVNNKAWYLEAVVMRKAADVQRAIAFGIHNDTLVAPVRSALTIDDGATIIVKCTGEATANDDIVQEGLTIEALTVGADD